MKIYWINFFAYELQMLPIVCVFYTIEVMNSKFPFAVFVTMLKTLGFVVYIKLVNEDVVAHKFQRKCYVKTLSDTTWQNF